MNSHLPRPGLSPLAVLGAAVLFLVAGWSGIQAKEAPEADRRAILGMAGEFKVEFNFRETESLQDGYQLKPDYHEDASELVLVVEDTGPRIVLQHLLLTGGGKRVVKHWKQIWTWEDEELIEFQGNNEWKLRRLSPAETAGAWSQLVTQVDDSPRYESIGKWVHDGSVSTWTSEVTARPLPRREEKVRNDYQILEGINVHRVTPEGWEHLQDNRKKVLPGGAPHYLAREDGLNTYTRTDAVDFTAARDYWSKNAPFWADVMKVWDRTVAQHPHFRLREEVDGKPLWRQLSPSNAGPGKQAIETVIDTYLQPLSS